MRVASPSDSATRVLGAGPSIELVAPEPARYVRRRDKGAFDRTVGEMTEYLLANNGPDARGRIHPHKAHPTVEEVSAALRAAKLQGLSPKWQPFHFSFCKGVYKRERMVDAVIQLRISASLRDRFDGDIFRIIREIDSAELKKPVSIRVEDREILVSTAVPMGTEQTSPFRVIRRYLRITGNHELADLLRPYHFPRAAKHAYEDKATVDEMVIAKFNHLLKTKFDGNLGRLFAEVTDSDLKAPVPFDLQGNPFEVSYFALSFQKFNSSPWKFIQYYLEITGQKEAWSGLKPYHLSDTSQGFFQDPAMRDEILVKKVNSVLNSNYGGDLWKLIRNTEAIELTSSFTETINGHDFVVSAKSATDPLEGSPFAIVTRYIELTGRQKEFWGLRQFHFERAARNTLADDALVAQMICKRLDPILESQFGGDIAKLALSLNFSSVLGPFVDYVGDHEIEVPFHSIMRRLGSGFEVLRRYLLAHGREDLATQFRPYLMTDAPSGTYQDSALRDELLELKIDHLLQQRFAGNRTRMLSECTLDHLQEPVPINFGGHVVQASCFTLIGSCGTSTIGVLSRYYEIKGLVFPYTWRCFQGPPETRLRRITGKLDWYDRALARDDSGICDTSVFGFTQFRAPGKDVVRKEMAGLARDIYGERPIRYLGLETEQFLGLRALCDECAVDLSSSAVVERDPRTFSAMPAMRREVSRELGEKFNNVRLIEGKLHERLGAANSGSTFTHVNFDFIGHLSSDKISAIGRLLSEDMLADDALIFVTLADRPVDRARAEKAGFGPDQVGSLLLWFERLGDGNYTFETIFNGRYSGGTGKRGQVEMLCLGLRVKRIGSSEKAGAVPLISKNKVTVPVN